jgi:hypothetical protein
MTNEPTYSLAAIKLLLRDCTFPVAFVLFKKVETE